MIGTSDHVGTSDHACPRCDAHDSEILHLRGLVKELQDRLMALIPDAMQAFHKTQQTTYAPGAAESEVTITNKDGEDQIVNVENTLLGH